MGNVPNWVVRSVVAAPDFMLIVGFADGSCKRYDMKPVLADGGIFRRIATPGVFAAAYADGTTVSWPGNIDIAPEELYENGVPCDAALLAGAVARP